MDAFWFENYVGTEAGNEAQDGISESLSDDIFNLSSLNFSTGVRFFYVLIPVKRLFFSKNFVKMRKRKSLNICSRSYLLRTYL